MPWRTATVMDDRARFVLEAELSDLPFAELCRRHHISRPTGYKWLERFRVDGMSGLHDRAHRTRSCPHATPPAVVDRILNLPERRGWGARKLARIVETARPFPERLVGSDYPGHFEVRRVSQIGSMRWRNQWVCVSHCSVASMSAWKKLATEFGRRSMDRFSSAGSTSAPFASWTFEAREEGAECKPSTRYGM
jgi:hypothetical protein